MKRFKEFLGENQVGKDLDGLRRHSEWNADNYQMWKNRGYTHADIKDMWNEKKRAKDSARSEVQQELKKKESEEKKSKEQKKVMKVQVVKPEKSKK